MALHIVRSLSNGILAALVAFAVGMAGPALADDGLNGHYQAIVDGSRANPPSEILIINTNCDAAGNRTGWVSTPKTWGAAISKPPVCTFAPATLAGSITSTKAAGGCGDPARPTNTHSLTVQTCVDDPNRGVRP